MKTKVLGLYMNLRPPEDVLSYPLRDDVPANILAGFDGTSEQYHLRCYAFFTAVFIVLRRWLKYMGGTRMSPEELIAAWSEIMCDLESTRRSEFFDDVDSQYKAITQSTGLFHLFAFPLHLLSFM